MNDIAIVLLPADDNTVCKGCIFLQGSDEVAECALDVQKESPSPISNDWDCTDRRNFPNNPAHYSSHQYRLVHRISGEILNPEELVNHERLRSKKNQN